MLHELNLMRKGTGREKHLKVPSNMSDDEFEEIIKKIDKHFSEGGRDIEHSAVRGRITDSATLEYLKKFFVDIYAATNSMANAVAISRNAINRRAHTRANQYAAAAAARLTRARASLPRDVATAARERSTTRTARRNVGRAAANAARARTARRRSHSRSPNHSTRHSRNGPRV
jgi:hypothetical protein